MTCPDPKALAAFSRGGLTPPHRDEIESHLDDCPTCCRVVAELVRIYTSDRPSVPSAPVPGDDETLTDEELPAARVDSRLRAGDRLDRYTILDLVGSGGMGVVYAAYDPSLDRKIALKVLHDRGTTDERAQRRLLREAQAMAKLAHPNVITVHEVREIDGRVFISMEFVGGTLGRWLTVERPDMPRIVAMFQDIGRGLAAAHAAGLVHSDVKPDNVLIGTDGRPRVTDFGLARTVAHEADDDDDDGRPDDAAPRERLDATATARKGLMGTPAYMAPEQLLREPPTAASDQFSFCVTLYEALWGSRPFTGRSLAQLAHNVVEGVRSEPEHDPGVPRWLRQVVMRGLSLRPEDRWPSMEVLIERLEPGPRRTKRRLAVAGVGALMLVGVGSLASRVLSAPPDPCEGGDRVMTELWSPEARGAVERALGRGSSRYATDTAALAVGRIDAYAQAWSAAQLDACQSYHRGAQSSEAFDLRGACLDERRRELEALVEVLVQGDAETRQHAVQAADGLRSLAPCEDVEVLRTHVPPPEDAATRDRVEQVEEQLARIRMLGFSGSYDLGLAMANVATEDARAIGYEPLLARVLHARASFHLWLGDAEASLADLREGWRRALTAGDDAVAAACVVEAVELLGYSLQRFDEAKLREEEAVAMIERVRRYDPRHAEELEGQLVFARGQIELRHHRYDTAIARFQEALAISERLTGPDSLTVAGDLNALASARLANKEWEAAVESFRRVLELRTRHLGDEHPATAHAGNNLGLALKNLGRLDEAAEHLEHSLRRLLASLGPDHPSIEMTQSNLATVYYSLRRYPEAVALYDAVYRGGVEDRLEDEYQVRRVHYYAVSLSRSGQRERARAMLEQVHARAQTLGLDGNLRSATSELARLDVEEGRPERALAALDGLTVDDAYPPFWSEVAYVRARALLEQGDAEGARALVPKIREAVGEAGAPSTKELDALVQRLDAAR